MKNTAKFLTFLFIFLASIFAFSQTASAAIVQLDTSFASSGYVTHNSAAGGNSSDIGESIQIQDDGKYVVAGYSMNASSDYDLAIWRYNTDGTLDTTFNSTGYVTHDSAAGGNGYDLGYSLKIQSDGKYVIAGCSANPSGNDDLAIWRYNSNGSHDTSFNSVGYVTHNNAAGGNSHDVGYSVMIQPDGKIIVAGSSTNASANTDLAIWRYNSNGSLDTSFNSTGYAIHNNAAGGNGSDGGQSLQIQSDGKYLIAGSSLGDFSSNDDLAIWRYNTNGTLDTSFNGTGYVTHNSAAGGDGSDNGASLRVQSDGKYIVAGYSLNPSSRFEFTLWRYNINGTLDTSFSQNGYFTNIVENYTDSLMFGDGLEIETNGKIVATGMTANPTNHEDLALWRLNSDGSLDTSFNDVGYITHDNAAGGSDWDEGLSLQIQSDGKYVIAGYSTTLSSDYDLAIWRYENLQQISTPSTLTPKVNGVDISTSTSNGVYGTYTVSIEKDSIRIAGVSATLTSDLDWTSVTGDVSTTDYRSFIHNLESAAGTGDSFSLFVPKTTEHNTVGICPNADLLDEVGPGCEAIVYYQETDPNVSVVSIGEVTYWKIDNLTGSGGFSTEGLPATGQATLFIQTIGLAICLLSILLFKGNLAKFQR